MNFKCKIDILLSTYNGAEYLDEQLASIVAQDIDEWQLIVRDDGSVDDSVSIIKKFVSNYSDRAVFFIPEPLVRLGVVASFEYLLTKSNSHYIVFCDQDDVWLPDKLRKLRKCMQYLESESESETPILVHSDLQVVNENLEKLADSFWAYQKLNPEKMQSLERLLIQNCVTGCATMINKSLLSSAFPIPKNVIMHDWWFALIAVSKGKVQHIDDKLVKYRQHAKNDTGAIKWNISYIVRGVFRKRSLYRKSILKTRDQARALLLSGKLNEEQTRMVSQYVNLFDRSGFSKRLAIMRMGFYKYGFIRNIALMLWL